MHLGSARVYVDFLGIGYVDVLDTGSRHLQSGRDKLLDGSLVFRATGYVDAPQARRLWGTQLEGECLLLPENKELRRRKTRVEGFHVLPHTARAKKPICHFCIAMAIPKSLTL